MPHLTTINGTPSRKISCASDLAVRRHRLAPTLLSDLILFDFYLWVFLKHRQFTVFENLDDLEDSILREIEPISPEQLREVRRIFENRLFFFCLARNRSHIAESFSK